LDVKHFILTILGFLIAYFSPVSGLLVVNYGEIFFTIDVTFLKDVCKKYLQILQTLNGPISHLLNVCAQIKFLQLLNQEPFRTIGLFYILFETGNLYLSTSSLNVQTGENRFFNWMVVLICGYFSSYNIYHLSLIITLLIILWILNVDVKISNALNIKVIEGYNEDNENKVLEPPKPLRKLEKNPLLNLSVNSEVVEEAKPSEERLSTLIPRRRIMSEYAGERPKWTEVGKKVDKKVDKKEERKRLSSSLENIKKQMEVETLSSGFEDLMVSTDLLHTDDTSIRKMSQDGICLRHDYQVVDC
jgi:hypothetical protein